MDGPLGHYAKYHMISLRSGIKNKKAKELIDTQNRLAVARGRGKAG